MDKAIFNPATGEKIAALQTHTADQVLTAVQQAAQAQKDWARMPARARGRVVYSLQAGLFAERKALARCISRCTGKSFLDAYSAEVFPSMMALKYYCRQAWKVLKPRKIKGSSILFFNKKSRLYREPFGVVGIISPWNYPLGIPFHEVIMALVAGNAVVLKVATQAQPVGDFLADLIARSDIPEGLFHLVHVPGAQSGEALLNAGIHKLFFTGSVAVGKELMAMAARTLTPVSLELGGNDPMIVYADANLPRAVFGALWAGFSNCGQSCGGVERILVHQDRYEAFKAEFVRQARQLRMGFATGSDSENQVDMGSLTTEKQKQTVAAHLADALEKGAEIVFQSRDVPAQGLYHPAVLLENVTPAMRIVREESFGPVMTLQPFETMAEAVAMANDCGLGLTASVWTRDRKRAQQTAALLETGAVSINDHLMTHGMAETPWGGVKESGIGRTHGQLGMEEMTEPKVVVSDLLGFLPRNIWWHPYSDFVFWGLDGGARFLFGREPLAGLAALVPLFLSRLKKPD